VLMTPSAVAVFAARSTALFLSETVGKKVIINTG
jgi:hypothetical protein